MFIWVCTNCTKILSTKNLHENTLSGLYGRTAREDKMLYRTVLYTFMERNVDPWFTSSKSLSLLWLCLVFLWGSQEWFGRELRSYCCLNFLTICIWLLSIKTWDSITSSKWCPTFAKAFAEKAYIYLRFLIECNWAVWPSP